jgi:hypothetical protein
MSETNQPQSPYDKLAGNVYVVSRNYFSASKRLTLHASCSQWTLSLLSLGLIVIPLLTVTQMPVRYPQNVVDFAAISLAVTVLMFSLLIGANKYSVRAVQMHSAGLELNELLREMRHVTIDADRTSSYKGFDDDYSSILRRFDNVNDIDYTRAKISIQKDEAPIKLHFKYWFLFSREMCIYAIAILLEFGFIAFLVTGNIEPINSTANNPEAIISTTQ